MLNNTKSIQGGLPKVSDGHTRVITVGLELPRGDTWFAWFAIYGVESRPIALPNGSVILPAACFLRESQRVSLAGFRVLE